MVFAKHQRWIALLAGSLAAAITGIGGFALYRAGVTAKQEKAAAANTRKEDKPPDQLSLPGQISAKDTIKVAVPVEGQILAVHAAPGDEVYEGQLLAEIVNTSLANAQQAAGDEVTHTQERIGELEGAVAAARLEASRAQADLTRVRGEYDRATRNHNRQKMLLAEGATPRQAYERSEAEWNTLRNDAAALEEVSKGAEARLASVQADLDNARKQLQAKTEDLEAAKARVDAGQVFSPVSGVVTARRGSPGEQVHPAMEDLFQIATNLSSLTIVVEPLPAALAKIRQGQEALIHVADLPSEVLNGLVSGISGGRVTITFANPSPLVKPGQTAQVRLKLP